MSRLPFDPRKMAAAKSAAKEEALARHGGTPLTVSQLASRIMSALAAGFPVAVRFVGEVSGFRDRTHWYFDLKDASAVVNCVMFQSAAKRLVFTPANGQQIVATGKVEFYAPGGKVSIIIEKIEPVGAGSLELAYRALCEELRGLGWFAPERKRKPPMFPRRVAVVTSRTGAALQDVLVTMRRRCPAVDVLVVDCRVQGAAAAPEIVKAVEYLSENAARLGIDAVLVTRGGGSMEDLWAFNDRAVAQAIVSCSVPVVAAIGHETDTTIAELVADERCATPTQAAMRLTPDAAALTRQVQSIAGRFRIIVSRLLDAHRHRVRSIASRPIFTAPARALAGPATALDGLERRMEHAIRGAMMTRHTRLERIATRLERQRPAAVQGRMLSRLEAARVSLIAAARGIVNPAPLNSLSDRLHRAASVCVREERAEVESLERQLAAVGPMQVLERGYSLTTSADGSLVRSPKDVAPGDRITTRLAAGSINSVVGDARGEQAPNVTRLPARAKRKSAPPDAAPGLFGG